MTNVAVNALSAGDPPQAIAVMMSQNGSNKYWADKQSWQDLQAVPGGPLGIDTNQVRIGDISKLGGSPNDGVWIGDYPPNDHGLGGIYIPPTQIIPGQPWIVDDPPVKLTVTTGYMQVLPLQWRIKQHKDSIELSTDLPGVKAKDLTLEVDVGTLKLSAKRSDTGESILRNYVLDAKYDPRTCAATLEDGVLTVTVKKLPEHMPRKIKITVK